MKFDRLFSAGFLRDTARTFEFDSARGKFNGLMFSLDCNGEMTQPLDGDRLSITLRGEKNTVLVNRMPLYLLSALSDMKFGYVGGGSVRPFQVLQGSLTAASYTDGTGDTFKNWVKDHMQINHYTFAIDLGMIHLGDSEIVCEIEVAQGAAGAAQTIQHRLNVYSYLINETTDYQLRYNISRDYDQWFRNTESLYLFGATTAYIFGTNVLDVEATLDTETVGSLRIGVPGMVMSTQLFGGFDAYYPGGIAKLYEIGDAIPEDLYLRVSGVDQVKVSILQIEKQIISKDVTKNTLAELDKLTARISKLEREKPDLAKALRHSGEIVKAEQLADVKANAEQVEPAKA